MEDDNNFADMATEREKEVEVMSDADIYMEMIKNILAKDDMPLEIRITILMEAIGDVSMIIAAIDAAVNNNYISEDLAIKSKELIH